MRRFLSMLFILFCLVGLACRALLPTPPLIPTLLPSAAPTAQPTPTLQPTPTSMPTAPANTAGFSVHYHPDGGLYAGDLISFEVVAPAGVDLENGQVQVELKNVEPAVIAQGDFHPFGIGARLQATLLWSWDTQGLLPGDYTLQFTVLPNHLTWRETVTLLPREDLPLAEQQAAWASASNECCVVHYLTHTEAERDLPELLLLIDTTARHAADSLGTELTQPITITLLPRLLGHGGFATNETHISYLDRNYSSGQLEMILHHEMIHILDSRLGGDLRPSLLVEGLAVYLTGGHFQPGPLLPRAATLLETWDSPPQPGLDLYLPLETLADDFYAAQHEAGYLQAGALIDYLVQSYGWNAFSAFYRGIQPDASGSQAQAIDAALQVHFGLSLAQLDQQFMAALRQQPASAAQFQEVQLTIAYYDTLRRYQRILDPSAYFLTAWLLDTPTMRQRGITADYVRHPLDASNLALEVLFLTTADEIAAGSYAEAGSRLQGINRVLQAFEGGMDSPWMADPGAAEYYALLQVLLQVLQQDPKLFHDYEPQRVEIKDETARAWVSNPTAELFEVVLQKTETGWQLQTPIFTGVP